MDAAEFKIRRERLGISTAWVAASVGVLDRQVQRWEQGDAPVSTRVVDLIEELEELALAVANSSRNVENDVLSFRNNSEYWADSPWAGERQLPASFYRAALGRVIDRISVSYAPTVFETGVLNPT